jgi:hypothetical protein
MPFGADSRNADATAHPRHGVLMSSMVGALIRKVPLQTNLGPSERLNSKIERSSDDRSFE